MGSGWWRSAIGGAAMSVVLVAGSAWTAAAVDGASTLAVQAPAAYADSGVPVSLSLIDAGGSPIAGAPVSVERQVDGSWSPMATITTDETGEASIEVVLSRDPADNLIRVSYAGDETHAPADTGEVLLALKRRDSRLRVTGPGSVVDETRTRLVVRWTTGSGAPVSGRVRLYRRVIGGEWRPAGSVTTDAAGRAERSVGPREDTLWRARVSQQAWLRSAVSASHRIDNRPPHAPVVLPSDAPQPRIALPPQPRATGAGARPVVSQISDAVWSQMTGRSWHAGCPVGRAGLRLLRINYWGYDGYRYRGELVAAVEVVDQMAGALTDVYDAGLPIRSMYRVDRFGWSSRLRGADDYASMAAGNTSAFNCRDVVGRPGVRSPHSTGRSIDINTWENPYRSAQGTVPNTWWQSRSHPLVAWRSGDHAMVRIMRAHGLAWSYGLGDTQHFDARRSARVGVDPGCATTVCE
ncbi:MAG: hypothetical protein F2667_07345 [Actinobacteria bacterium]|nr:hypothetical protein [Actinomycetota bacterium]